VSSGTPVIPAQAPQDVVARVRAQSQAAASSENPEPDEA